ncbi:helix-turn-helix domain-containing protein [Thermosinus carboxydivorans]|uniref:helix-turn-helix domain-containing protein n=1 Tax=Thermosinus carboxydivorans TaxID=261685 RepID=UPI0002FB240F|nr:helix-turn-helix domain-containing protein [Thermosinus carboxydivorans]
MTNILKEVLTVPEAAELWGLDPSTIKKAILGQRGYPPRFAPDEVRKSAGTWLVTRAAMKRVYGPQPKTGE